MPVVFNAPTSPINLCHNAEAPSDPPNLADYAEGWILEGKMDGWRLLAHVTEEGAELYTRTGHSQRGKLLEVEAELAQLPAGTWIDGEAVGEEWNAVQRCLGCSVLRKARAQADPIRFVAFDLISHAGIDVRILPFVKRREALETIFAKHDWDRVKLIEQVSPTDANLTALIEAGYEGGVLKSLGAPYASGRRGRGQIKLKPQETSDFIVMDFKEGEHGFAGLIGSIVFGSYRDGELVESGRCSGMDMATRVDISENPEDYIGKVIEVAYMGRVGDGYRHPQYRRLRTDKSAEACQ